MTTPGAGIFRTLLPTGFYASGVNCGVRRYRPDLGLVLSDEPCVAVGVFTQSTCQAAPVKYCQSLLPATNIKAIITNSGEANAATGLAGELNNQKMAHSVAQALGCDSQQVLTASTGVIGVPMSIDKITEAVPSLVNHVTTIAEKFALAILTTDLVPKTVYKTLPLSQGQVTITGICKGSGMIHPNMATMLGYLLSDIKISPQDLNTILKTACDQSFNMISVDGETSTNDSVFMLANGMSGVSLLTDEDMQIFQQAVTDICIILAKSIARDGEGASKLIEVNVQGVPDSVLAKKIARTLTLSPLIKTAMYGESANWGRILARVGMEQVPIELLTNCQIHIQGQLVYADAAPAVIDAETLAQQMKQDTIVIDLDFAAGEHQATAWGCDLTEKYVKINAEYLT